MEKKIDIDSKININIEQAIPLGLIVNELVTNIFKHAFPEPKKNAKFEIKLVRLHGDKLQLTIADNGVGLPKKFNFKKIDSLGLKLMRLLVKQIRDDIEVKSSKYGTTFEIIFKI
jgi:hypothetical protein